MKRFLKNIQAICLLATSFACFSCSPDGENIDSVKPYTGERVLLGVEVSTRGESKSDAEVQTIRAIVFANTNQLVYNDVRDVTSASDEYELSIQAGRGMNNIYFICNETSEMKAKLKAITSPNEIEELTYPTTVLSAPVPMYAKVENAKVTANPDGTNVEVEVGGTTKSILEVTVKRLLAKLSLTVIKNIPTGGQKFAVEEVSYKICRMPKYSYLSEGKKFPKDGGWAEQVRVVATGKLPLTGTDGDYILNGSDYTIPTGVNSAVTPEAYIPEYLLAAQEDGDLCTYLLIEAKCQIEGSTSYINSNYCLDIGELPPANHNILRNTHYKIYATITGLGASGFYAEIVPINEYNLPLNFSSFEGYVITTEETMRATTDNTNIVYDYSQYSGILKIAKTDPTSKKTVINNALFKYGSVVALSDATTAAAFSATTDVLWRPNVNIDSAPTLSTWSDIPSISSGIIEHTLDGIKQGKGDPCRLLGLAESEIEAGKIDNGIWRMPNKDEMKWLITAKNSEMDATKRGFYSFYYLLTPNSGYRTADGTMVPAAKEGRYWNATENYPFVFNGETNEGSIETTATADVAYSVRCIRQTIPPSRFSAGQASIDYLGATVQPFVTDTYLTPMWKYELKDPADATYITLTKSQGTYNETMKCTVAPLPNPYQGKDYLFTRKAYGLDGVVHTFDYQIRQRPLEHHINVSVLNFNDFAYTNGYRRIPKAGATLEVSISIDPAPLTSYIQSYPTAKWISVGYYYTNKENYVNGSEAYTVEQTPGDKQNISKITIPENTWGHIIAVEIMMAATESDKSKYPPYKAYKEIFIQEAE